MGFIKTALATTMVVGVVSGGGYTAGYLFHHQDQRPVAAPRAGQHPQAVGSHHGPTSPTHPTPSPAKATATATPVPDVLRAGDSGTKVRELQQRLHQLAWFGETTSGTYDTDTSTALKGFQAKRGLTATGRLDARTWGRLVSMTKQPTHDAMFNVLHPGPAIYAADAHGTDVRGLQARLKALDWYFGDVTGTYDAATASAVKGFQGKRQIPVTGEVDKRTMDRLDAMTYAPTHDAMYNIEASPGALDARCLHGRVLCIDKTSRTLRWVVDGHVVKTLDARFGSTLNDTPTREGLFHVYLMDADHVSNLFGSSMPYAMFFSGGQAVHYSSDFATYGYYGASHGCVNIRGLDGVRWLFSQVRVGDKVVVYWS